jgi:gliding motility-associated-like protein
VAVEQKAIPSFSADRSSGCSPLTIQFSNSSLAPANSFYRWDFGDGTISTDFNTIHSFNLPDFYTVRLYVVTPAGCVQSFNMPFIEVLSSPVASFGADPFTADIRNPYIKFRDESSDQIRSWEWNFGDGNGYSKIQNPSYIYKAAGDYMVNLVVTNNNGCHDSTTRFVHIGEIDYEIWIPNSFTPNGDGLNDVFNVTEIGVSDFEMVIFNRWGDAVFKTTDPQAGWNGKLNGNQSDCESDVYGYVITVKDRDSVKHIYRNKLKLLR